MTKTNAVDAKGLNRFSNVKGDKDLVCDLIANYDMNPEYEESNWTCLADAKDPESCQVEAQNNWQKPRMFA